jgi:uncharacterized RDD family membrane protein YckC
VIWHEVLTTEKVPFRYRVAGLGSRFLAWLVDLCVLFLLYFVAIIPAGVLESGRPGLGQALVVLWVFAVNWGYFLLCEWLWHGRTVGKRALGIRVISRDGTAVAFYQSAVRNILRVADSLPIPIPIGVGALGFVVAACNRQNRRLGDFAADTLVVHVERGAKPIRALHDGRAGPDRARLALLRQRLGQLDREQKQALLDLCLRREQLRPAERAALFQAAAHFVQARLELAPETYESPEKFVVQLGAVLGERGAPTAGA